MFNMNADPRMKVIYPQLCNMKHEFLLNETAVPSGEDLILKNGVKPLFTGTAPAVKNALDDLKSFFKESLGVKTDAKAFPLEVKVKKDSGASRKYAVKITEEKILVEAETPLGASRAIYRIQSLLKLRRAPFLKKENFDSSHDMNPSLTHLAFKSDSTFELEYPEAYQPGYLRRIARAGYTGVHINLSIEIFFKSLIFPEFDAKDGDRKLRELNAVCKDAADQGLEIFLSIYLNPVSGDHPVFKRLPEVRGSRFVATDNAYILCSSHPLVRKFYCEQFDRLFRNVPLLAGVLMIAGCEGWLHCHTACTQNPDGSCDCPRCAEQDPEKSVAEMFNQIAAAIRNVRKEARPIVWTYGIFAWSETSGRKFVSQLSKNCEVMANFDTGDDYSLEGAEASYFDYSLKCVGPATPYLAQKAAAEKKKIPMHAKCESGCSLEYYSLQTMPAMTRWERKYANILKEHAAGALFNWKFIGYTESLSAELAGLISSGIQKNTLKQLAIREFGEENEPVFRKAWKKFDKAIDYHPFSGRTSGYFKGPFYLGFAHPLLMSPDDLRKMPEEFFNHKTRIMVETSLAFVQPFGVKACLSAITKLEKYWTEGCEILKQVKISGKDPYLASRTAYHLALCNAEKCLIRSAKNMVKFYALRENLNMEAFSPEQAKIKLLCMRDIAAEELENTKEGLSLIREYPLIAFSYVYRYGISESMCEFKIRHTEHLIKVEIPMRHYQNTFGRTVHPEWLQE